MSMIKDDEEIFDEEISRLRKSKKRKYVVGAIVLSVLLFFIINSFIIKKSDDQEPNKVIEKETLEETSLPDGNEEHRKLLKIDEKKIKKRKNEYICEFSEIQLPEILAVGDFVDIRLSLADGRNFTVISNKEVERFSKKDGREIIYLPLCEEEIIILDSAISDTKIFENSKLYLVIGSKENINLINYPVNKNSEFLLRPRKEAVKNLTDYPYEVVFDEKIEKERVDIQVKRGLKEKEWKDAVSYWNLEE